MRQWLAVMAFLPSLLLASEADKAQTPSPPEYFVQEALQDIAPPSPVSSTRGDNVLGNLRLGFVNFRRIMATSKQLEDIRQKLEKEFQSSRASLEKSQNELEQMAQALQNAQDPLRISELEEELIAKKRDIAQQNALFRDNYSIRRNEEVAKLQTLVLEQIVALAKEKQFDVILNDMGVIYVSDGADLTPLVIERVNALSKK